MRDKEHQRLYRKAYYHSHKEQERARKQNPEYKKKQREYMRQRRCQFTKEIDKIFGKKCYLCNNTKIYQHDSNKHYKLEMHEIHNHKHVYGGVDSKQYYLSHKEDFVRLCTKCHHLVSWLGRKYGKTWEEIATFLNI